MEKNFIGLSEYEEQMLLLLAEGNNQNEVADILHISYSHARHKFGIIREILGAKTNEEAISMLLTDFCLHGNIHGE